MATDTLFTSLGRLAWQERIECGFNMAEIVSHTLSGRLSEVPRDISINLGKINNLPAKDNLFKRHDLQIKDHTTQNLPLRKSTTKLNYLELPPKS